MHIQHKGDKHGCFGDPRLTARDGSDLGTTSGITGNDNRTLLRVY